MLTVEPVPTATHRAVGTPQVKVGQRAMGIRGEVTVASPRMREVLFANGEAGGRILRRGSPVDRSSSSGSMRLAACTDCSRA